MGIGARRTRVLWPARTRQYGTHVMTDSKRPRGSGVDRHDNIGEGFIGVDGFKAIMEHPAFSNAPFLLEVPGSEGDGPDSQNIDLLKSIRQEIDGG